MISQKDRLGILHASGTDLALVRFCGDEAVNALAHIDVECISEKGGVDFNKLLGRNVTVELRTIDPAHPPRYFDGLLTEARETTILWGGHGYALTLRPWLWLLGLRQNQKIFHEMTAPQIIEAVFAEYGHAHENLLQRNYPVLEYTVQFAESDLDFVTRLMAMFGINHTTMHEKGAHKIVLFDDVDSLPEVPGGARPLRVTDRQYRDVAEHLHDWRAERRMTTGRVALVDYNFKTPRSKMDAEQAEGTGYSHDDLESFIFPGGYPDQELGKKLAETRLKQVTAADGHYFAEGDCVGLGAGMRTGLSGHPDKALNDMTYAVICASHEFLSEGYRTGDGGTIERDTYQGRYEFIETSRPLVPAAAPAAPRVQGPQTAMVVGEGEIDCDEYGRILVKFHWDREGAKSMRCRVAQMWAGKNWGGIVIPRVGMEVLVEFLGGDPAQPLVTGCVYNDDNKPPFELPGAGQIMGMKSNSTPGGGGYNELVFDDTKGNEELRIHAQYDLNAKVLNDQTWEILRNCTTTVNVDDVLTVGENHTLTVGEDRTTEIGMNDTLDVGQTLQITAGQKITLQVGMSKIEMDGSSITLQSPTIELKATMQFKSTAGITSEHKAGAMFDIKGALVKINS
ncbi:type VI secretion system Vgr family protein [Roseinatronobacter alkalisoli]|uniref:Type VI secretion system tip protein TssI/VgrG n=1 Tax=Roseinatronobacter alkalisoli TaxID=3028235 RepID=A0ABT5TCL7_9RHOB|nr:type VI secretion system tip protein TssI/VgrG [Roseinatronobacter sp. HJB301]MDD7972862.1 type VI secretion system tip protein TssI/VgrG [Roseinatronobacter sp. HJB301]